MNERGVGGPVGWGWGARNSLDYACWRINYTLDRHSRPPASGSHQQPADIDPSVKPMNQICTLEYSTSFYIAHISCYIAHEYSMCYIAPGYIAPKLAI